MMTLALKAKDDLKFTKYLWSQDIFFLEMKAPVNLA